VEVEVEASGLAAVDVAIADETEGAAT
jgi:hypothetical protein